MVAFSLTAPARYNRPVNPVLSVLYAVSVVTAAIGETWAYYIIGSVVEVLPLLAIAALVIHAPAPTNTGRERTRERARRSRPWRPAP